MNAHSALSRMPRNLLAWSIFRALYPRAYR